MIAILTFALSLFSIAISAQAKLNLVFQKSTITVQLPNDSANLSTTKDTDQFYSLNLTKETSEYFLAIKSTNEQTDEFLYDNYIYKDLENKIIVYDLLKKQQENLPEFNWLIHHNTDKKILGYPVKKATLKLDPNTSVIAWYTPSLPYKNGPDIYHGLPGLILEIEKRSTNEITSIIAKSLQMSKNKDQIINPYDY